MRDWIISNLDRLYGFAFALTHDPDAARDLVQESVLRALEARNTPCESAAYRAWLFKILRNAFIDRCRKENREVGIGMASEIVDDIDSGWNGDHRIVDVITIRIAIRKLPLVQREIISLVDFVGCSYAEAAKVLDIAEGTVMSRLSRARRALLDVISEDNVAPLVRTSKSGGI